MNRRTRFWLTATCVGAVLLAGVYFGGRHLAWPMYEEWRDDRLTRLARTMADQGDYDNAILVVRRLLRGNQTNAEAWRFAAELAEKRRSAEAIGYQAQYARLTDTLEARLDLLRLCLEFGAYRQGAEAIEAIGDRGVDEPRFHRLAADLHLQVGRQIPARLHLGELVRLSPDDEQARFDLARLELTLERGRGEEDSRQRLRDLASNPEMRVAALTVLAQDAVAREDAAEAAAHARALLAEPERSINAELAALQGLWLGDREAAGRRIETLKGEFAERPESAYLLLQFLQQKDLQSQARRWYESLPEETQEHTAVRVVMARIYAQLQDWRSLRHLTGGSRWAGREYLQHAYQAYEARENGRRAEADDAWKLAAIKGGDSPRAALELIGLTTQWQWERERYDMVWRLFVQMPGNLSVQQQLVAWERRQGRTDNLNRIFARLVDFHPDDPVAKNNFAYTSLLLRENLARAHALAREVHAADPNNPYYKTTLALSLYRQNKYEEGLAMIESVDAAALAQPERVLLRAVLQAAAGREEQAASTLEWLVDARRFLPEERTLLADAREGVVRWARLNNVRSEVLAWQNTDDAAEAQGWAEMLPPELRPELDDAQQLSNQLYAKQDWSDLSNQLRQQRWGDQEHLRIALTAYLLRHHQQRGDRVASTWRTALQLARDARSASQLETLAARWQWEEERIAAADRRFTIQPSDREMLNELLAHYRRAGRTADLVRLLNIYVSVHPDEAGPARALAYYRMLSGLDAARAFVSAKRLYDEQPGDADSRLLYAFALWRQDRSEEAWALLDNTDGNAVDDMAGVAMPVDLLAAAVLLDLEQPEQAGQRLAAFQEGRGLPEEDTLARNLRRRLEAVPGARTAAAL